MDFGFVSFAVATMAFVIVAVANLESLAPRADASNNRSPPPSRD